MCIPYGVKKKKGKRALGFHCSNKYLPFLVSTLSIYALSSSGYLHSGVTSRIHFPVLFRDF